MDDAKNPDQDGGNDDSSVSDFSDHIDNLEEDDLINSAQIGSKKKQGAIGKKAAIDRYNEDNNIEELNCREDEADDTVFIDNLPKDEASLKVMIKEVNQHIRMLEHQFFEEEDSDVELELK